MSTNECYITISGNEYCSTMTDVLNCSCNTKYDLNNHTLTIKRSPTLPDAGEKNVIYSSELHIDLQA